MSSSPVFNAVNAKTPSEVKAKIIDLFSSMPPDKFIEHMKDTRSMAMESGREREREEIVCRLLASGMTVEEIAVILCIRTEAVRIIEHNNATTTIPEYAKKLKERRKRRQK